MTQDIRGQLIEWSKATDAFKGGDISARSTKYGLEDQLEPLLRQLSGDDIALLKADAEAGPALNRICEALDIKLAAAESQAPIAADPADLLSQWQELEAKVRQAKHQPLSTSAEIAQYRAMQEQLSALGDALAAKLKEMHDDGILSAFERTLDDRAVLYRAADEVGCHQLFNPEAAEGIEPTYDDLVHMQQRLKAAWAFADEDSTDWEDDQIRRQALERFADEYEQPGDWVVRAYNVHLSHGLPDDKDRFVRAQRSVENVARQNVSEAITRLRVAILSDQAGYKQLIADLSDQLEALDDCDSEYEEVRARRDGYRAFVREHVRELDVALEPQPQPKAAPVTVATVTETATELEQALAQQIDEILGGLDF